MARKQNNDDSKKDEQITVLRDGPADDVELPPVDDEATAQVRGSALANNPPEAEKAEAQAEPIRKYIVTRGGPALVNGMRTQLREGKIVDNHNYDIRHLQRQGIKLAREESYVPDGFVE